MLRDLIEEAVNSPGTSVDIPLGGATIGRRAWLSATTYLDGDQGYYWLTDEVNWEWGVATLAAGSPAILSRTTVLGNTAGTTARLNFTGPCRVYCEAPATALAYRRHLGPLSVGGDAIGGALWCGLTGGTANAITANPVTPLASNLAGSAVDFVASATNTGPATLSVSGLAALPLLRNSAIALRAGDVLNGHLVRVICDGTSWRLAQQIAREIGEIIDYAGGDTLPGCIPCDGRNIMRATYPGYAARMASDSYPHGAGNGTTTVGVPDLRGRVTVGRDDMGGTAAGRLANSIGNANAATLGFGGGDDRMPQHTHSTTQSPHAHGAWQDPHSHNYNKPVQAVAGVDGGVNAIGVFQGTESTATTTSAQPAINVGAINANITVDSAGSGTTQNAQPLLVTNKQIYVGG